MKLRNVRSWPVEVPSGSFTVKIYRVRNKERRSFMVSYFVGDKRKQKMFVDFDEAYEEAKGASEDVNNGETTAVNMPNKDRVIFTHASEAVAPTGVGCTVFLELGWPAGQLQFSPVKSSRFGPLLKTLFPGRLVRHEMGKFRLAPCSAARQRQPTQSPMTKAE
jgi:hypothetical protein